MANFCGNCGNKITDDSQFCPNCGSRIVDPSTSSAPAEVKENKPPKPEKRRSGSSSKLPAMLIAAAVILTFWLASWITLAICNAKAIAIPFVVRAIAFLSFAYAGISRNVLFVIGGWLGKGLFVLTLLTFATGGYRYLTKGLKTLGSSLVKFSKPSALPTLLYGVGAGAVLCNFFMGGAEFSLCMICVSLIAALICVLGGGLDGKSVFGKNIPDLPEKTPELCTGAVCGCVTSVFLSLIPWGFVPYCFGAACLIGGGVLSLVFGDGSKEADATAKKRPGLRKTGTAVLSFVMATVILVGAIVPSVVRGSIYARDPAGRVKYKKYEVSVPEGAIPGDRSFNVTERDGGIDITVEGLEHTELEKPVTISFTLKKKVSPADVDHYIAMYTDSKGNTYYYTPDREKLLNEGVVEFETCHFSFWSVEKLSDEELAEKTAEELAARDIIREKQQEKNTNLYWPYMTELYKKMGITDDTVAGKLARTALDKFGNQIKDDQVKTGFAHKVVTMTTLMSDGDMSGMCGLLSQVAFESLADNWGDVAKNYGGAIANALPGAVYSAIVEEKPAEAAIDVMKAIAVTCCPTITYYQLAADLAEMAVDTWKDGEMERLYKIYRGDEVEGSGGFYGKTFEEMVSENMRGFYFQYMRDYKEAFCSLYGFEPEDISNDPELKQRVEKSAMAKLKQDFEARLESDTEISKRKQEYMAWIKACQKFDKDNPDYTVKLITRTTSYSGFGPDDDMELRIYRLMTFRKQVLDLIKEKTDGATLEKFFGTANVDKQNQELAYLVWIRLTTPNYKEARAEIEKTYYFKQWAKEHAPKGGRWVLVDTIYEPVHETVVETGDAWESAKNKKITFWRNGATVYAKHEEDGYADFVKDVGFVKDAYTFEELYTVTIGTVPKTLKEGEKIALSVDISHCGDVSSEEDVLTKHAITYISAWLLPYPSNGVGYGSIPAFDGFNDGVNEDYYFRPELYGLNETYSCTMYATAPTKDEMDYCDYSFAVVCSASQDNYWNEVVRYVYQWRDK